jgi:hypothetical protein
MAQTTTLLCDEGDANNSQVTLALDQAAGKVTMTFSLTQAYPQRPVPGPMTLTLGATFAPDVIRFSKSPSSGDHSSYDYSLDRSTGIVSVIEIKGGTPFHYSWTCQVSKPQF